VTLNTGTMPAEPFEKLHSPEITARARKIVARYPHARSAALPLLHLAQEIAGFVGDDAVEWVAAQTGATPAEILGTVSFYPMFRRAPAGRRTIRVCRGLSCELCGSAETMRALETEFGLGGNNGDGSAGGSGSATDGEHASHGGTTADGAVTLEYVECLAACGAAPVVQVDASIHENLTADRVPALAAEIRTTAGIRVADTSPPSPEGAT
jgi:NADH-quinone oxidoreductase subunit E